MKTIDSDPEATAVANAEELNAIRFQTLEDWTPMTDLCVLKAQQDDGVESVRHAPYAKASLTYETPDRVFFTSGKTPHGCISELRSGYRLELSQRIVVDDFRGVHRMVSFRLGSQPLISLLLSFPYQTLLVHDPFGVEELSAVAIADEPLLATAQYKDNSTFDELILVFPSSITILATGQSRDPTSVASIPSLEDKAIIPINHTTAAVIDVESRLIIVAETTETGSHIQLKKRDSEESSCTFVDIGPGVSLGSEVTSMTLLRNAKSRLISMAVATADGMLYFYTLDDLGQSRNIVSLQARLNAGDDQPAACESLCVMRYQTAGIQENNPLLLCGRRDGMLDVVDLETDATEIGVSLSIRDTYTMGSGPLSVYPDEGNPGGAFVFCDSTACYVELPKRTTTNQVRVTGIWTSDPDDSSLKNEPVSAFCQLSNLHPDDDADRSIMMLFGSTLVLASIKPATAPELVLRRLPLRGTPTRIMYSESLKRLVVASTVFHTSNNESYSKRYALSSIQLVDPDSGASLLKDADGPSADSAKTLPASLRSPGQKATSMLEWVLRRDDNRKTIFIVVSAMNTHAARTTGSIVFFKVRKSSGGEFSLQYYQELQEHEPVYSTCLLGDGHSMLYCCGKELRIMKWIPSEKRFRRKTLQTFTSPLRQVSTQDSMIYITTSSSVITIFRFSQDRLTNLQDTGSLTLVKQDNKSRSALSHSIKTPIAEIITSDMHRSIATFSNPHPPDLPSSGAVIEATLPASIVRFACADLRSYRRHNSQISAADWRTIGISADGTITSFAKVDDASWRLLRFLQNLCLRDKRICPVQNRQALRRMHVEPDSTNPRYRHIDGDVLERLVKRADAEELVGEMLDAEVGREMRDYQSTEVRRERFEECASAAGMVGLQAGLDNDGDGREVVREAVRYLRRLLEVS
ncbi:MAG: hypothetical protein M1828_003201 [Chrysothrix sp. TS-e1954]|nr:MAG: hypothetical protein M1828_003201 [Chrysothrix sp. TS-e1954]